MASTMKWGGQMTAFFTPPEFNAGTRTDLILKPENFAAATRRKSSGEYLLIGADSEYKTPERPLTRDEIKGGQANYDVLSYQFSAKASTGETWEGIHCPQKTGDRLAYPEFLVMALAMGIEKYPDFKIPRKIIFIGHFNRADHSAFSDFNSDLRNFLNNVRNTFISIDSSAPVEISWSEAEKVTVYVSFRDSILIAPEKAKRLEDLGDLLGLEKIKLHDDKAIRKTMIRNMDVVRRKDWELFRRYALRDAEVCLLYTERIMEINEELTGTLKVPVTLSGIGVDLLMESWQQAQLDPLRMVGKEAIIERKWDARRGRMAKVRREVFLPEVHMHLAFATECYHGGCNQQRWFGPGFTADWVDYDLSSAYPTAMSMIGVPDWENIREETDACAFKPDVLGLAWVDFEFPRHVTAPCLPCRTANGLIYPRRGRTFCGSPEIYAALNLGAHLTIRRGLIVPTNNSVRIFGDFIEACIKRRKNAANKLLNAFWKEISNSTYGKLAQGLQQKRVFDMRSDSMELLPESRITNPFLAAYVTSYVRALLNEIINRLPPSVCVFSATTDGFLSNAGEAEITVAQAGPLATLFKQARERLTGEMKPALEPKHIIRRPLGWRTRGQATLDPANNAPCDVKTTLLAKAGIYTESALDTIEDQNEDICQKFFTRTPQSIVTVKSSVGLREMLQYGADFVEKQIIRRLSMEYDWKRRPIAVSWSNTFNHIFFNTEPWETVHQFDRVRELWDEYRIVPYEYQDGRTVLLQPCLKTIADYEAFAQHVETQTHITGKDATYLSKAAGDLKRLRQQLSAAWHRGEAGFTRLDQQLTHRELAAIITEHVIGCSLDAVRNGKRVQFKPGSVPATERAVSALQQLKNGPFPGLQVELFVKFDSSAVLVTLPVTADGPFMDDVD